MNWLPPCVRRIVLGGGAGLLAAIAALAFAADTDRTAPLAMLGEAARAAARFDYLLHCAGCHRPDGSGAPPEVPSLRGPMGLMAATPDGRAYVARVPEVAQSPLGDAELARLLNWVLSEFNAETLPAGFRPLTNDEVGAARVRVLADPLRARAALLGGYGDGAEASGTGRSP